MNAFQNFSGVRGDDNARRDGDRRRSTAARTGLALAGGAVLVTLATGCASTLAPSAIKTLSGQANPAVSDAASGAAVSPSAAGGSTAIGGGAPTAQASAASSQAASLRCHTSELTVTVGANNPGAGQENFAVVLTNRSSRTCTVYGYPGVGLVFADGRPAAPAPTRETSATKTLISLAPGRSAWAALSFGNPAISGAATATPATILVTPPDETASLSAAWSGGAVPASGNSSTIFIGTLQAGTGS